MKYQIKPTTQFKRDLKTIQKRGYNLKQLTDIIQLLADGQKLPLKNRDHALSGNYFHCRECHITPDWLLIYEIVEKDLLLYLTRTGTHSDLF